MEMQAPLLGRFSAKDLSRVDAFRLGPVIVDPGTRSLSAGERRVTVEPRVMQVLVALGLDAGQVLSRDDLIALCWDGRIVGDNAINRVVSLLRQALARCAGDAVRLETITKVGFRLVVADEPERSAPDAVRPSAPRAILGRRKLIAGGALLAAAAAAGGFTALRYRGHVPDPRAVQLAQKADQLMKSGLPGSTRQATRYLQQAVEIDPEFAAGWGQLACMYHHAFQGFSDGERKSYPQLLTSAAKRALALEPDQPDAKLALVVLDPDLGRWREAERDLRAIRAGHPDHWYANGQLNLLLMDVGRFADALPFREAVVRIDPTIPVAWMLFALNQFLANRIHESDATFDRAMATWPAHPALWFTRYSLLLETGRPAEAAAFVRDVRHQPDGLPPQVVAENLRMAEAVGSSDRTVRKSAAEYVLSSVQVSEQVPEVAPMLAMLGEGDRALEACAAYFLGGRFAGHDWPAPTRFDDRMSSLLFYPSILTLRERPAYSAILERTGLEDYWKQSGSQPDFRRG